MAAEDVAAELEDDEESAVRRFDVFPIDDRVSGITLLSFFNLSFGVLVV